MTNEIGIRITGDGSELSAVLTNSGGEVVKFSSQVADASNKADRSFRKTSEGAKKQNSEIRALRRQIVSLVSAYVSLRGAQALGGLADEYKSINAQIGLVTNGMAAQAAAQSEVFRTAQDTRGALGATANLYARLRRSLGDVSDAHEIAIATGRAINQSFLVTAATSQEAAAATIQLSQGLASGVLRGQEFNSVMEQAPGLALAIAQSLGVTIGELRAMAEEGELTTKKVLRGILLQSVAFQRQADEIPTTISQALQQARNAWLLYVGQVDEARGVSGDIVAIIAALSRNLPQLVSAVVRLGVVTASWFILFQAGPRVIKFYQEIVAEIVKARKQTALLRGATAALFTFIAGFQLGALIREQFVEVRIASITFIANLMAGWERVKSATAVAVAFLKSTIFEFLNVVRFEWAKTLDRLAAGLDRIGLDEQSAGLRGMATELRKAAAETESFEDAKKRLAKALATELAAINASENALIAHELKTEEAAKATSGAAESTEDLEKRIAKLLASLDKLPGSTSAATAAAKELAKAQDLIAQSRSAALAVLDPEVDTIEAYAAQIRELLALIGQEGVSRKQVEQTIQLLIRARDRELDALRDQTLTFRDLVDGLQEEIDLLGLSNQEREIEVALRQLVAQAQQQGLVLSEAEIQQLREQLELLQQIRGQRESLSQLRSGNTFDNVLQRSFEALFKDGADAFLDVLRRDLKEVFSDPELTAQFVNGAAQLAAFAVEQFRQNPDAPLRGLNNTLAAANIPIVSEIAQAVSAIDSIFGGRLLGTNFATDSTGLSLAFGAGGFGGSTFENQSRQRSFFRGTARRTITSNLDAQTQSQLDDFFASVGQAMGDAARRLAVSVPALIAGNFEQEFDADGNLVRSTSNVLGRVYEESLEEFQQRLLAENILAVISNSVGDIEVTRQRSAGFDFEDLFGGAIRDITVEVTELVNEAQFIAERWRDSSQALLEGAQFLLVAQDAIQRGQALLNDSLLETTNFVEAQSRAGETLTETFVRLVSATESLTNALGLLGIGLDLNREELIIFAADIADAAGGIDRATQLWNRFFSTFFSQEELLQSRLAVAETSLASQFADIGLDPSSVSAAQFRDLFESQLPTLSAAAVVEWLEAAEALGIVIDLEDQLNTLRNDVAAQELQRQEELRGLLQGLQDGVNDLTFSEYQIALRDLRREFDAARQAAIELGASHAELARIDQLLAIREARLRAERLAQAQDLVAQLFGTPLEQIEAQIAEIQSRTVSPQLAGIDQVANANRQRYQAELRAIERIRDTARDLLFDVSVSSLTPGQRFTALQAEFQSTLAAARGGDLDAREALPDIARQFAEATRGRFFSSAQGDNIIESIRQALLGFEDPVAPTENPVVAAINQGNAELRQLIADRDALIQQQQDAQRQAIARELVVALNDLAEAEGRSTLTIAERLGADVRQLTIDLGADLNDLTAATALQLAGIASSLGVDLDELAEAIGLQIGSLQSSESLLNDALELAIDALPEAFREELEPLLRALEDATTDADATEALAALEAATLRLPVESANALAPFLSGVETTDPNSQQLTELQAIGINGTDQLVALESIDSGVFNVNQNLRDVAAAVGRVESAIRRDNDLKPAVDLN